METIAGGERFRWGGVRFRGDVWVQRCDEAGAQVRDDYDNDRGVGGDILTVRVFPPDTRPAQACLIGCSTVPPHRP